jgi:hypothetical protein
MTRFIRPALFAVVAASAVVAGPARSQDTSLTPNYGTARLSSGFTPDPYRVEVVAGGSVRTDKGGVAAWVSNAPDFRLHYTGGGLPLTFQVRSGGDTTLLINTPDGRWVANDDADGTLNPRITIEKPASGRYEIWVGSVSRGEVKATLSITELR